MTKGYKCPLGKLQATRPDPEQTKREGWRQQGILVVAVEDERLDFVQREMVKVIGEALYGTR